MLISLVICTYNRADLLAGALDSIATSDLDKSEFEVIVVDNNSTDNTASVVTPYLRKMQNLRYVHESEQGVSYARNRGWREANGEFVAYFDDDAKAPKSWLSVAAEIIRTKRPHIFGGPYYAFYNSPKPVWFRDSYESVDLGPAPRYLTAREYLYGTNIFLRKELLSTLGGFDAGLGMKGEALGYGEETALMLAAWVQWPDLKVYYDPRLFVHHLVGSPKMRLGWVARQKFVAGQWAYLVFSEGDWAGIPPLTLLRDVIRDGGEFLLCVLRGVVARDRNRHPDLRNYLYEESLVGLSKIGSHFERLRCALKFLIRR